MILDEEYEEAKENIVGASCAFGFAYLFAVACLFHWVDTGRAASGVVAGAIMPVAAFFGGWAIRSHRTIKAFRDQKRLELAQAEAEKMCGPFRKAHGSSAADGASQWSSRRKDDRLPQPTSAGSTGSTGAVVAHSVGVVQRGVLEDASEAD